MFKPEWGMASLIKLSTFIAVGNGFVFDGGQDVFGIDVFVTPSFKNWEVFFSVENIRDPIFSWKLNKFSTLIVTLITLLLSFSSGGRNWRVVTLSLLLSIEIYYTACLGYVMCVCVC